MITEQNIKEFYKAAYFGKQGDSITCAVNRAYRDICRTIVFKPGCKGEHSIAVKNVETEFRCWLGKIDTIKTQEEYDKWHRNLCEIVKLSYSDAALTVGQQQKWVNMTMKYLIVLEKQSMNSVIGFLHVPIDRIVLERTDLRVFDKNKPWSRIDNWDDYDRFQKLLREGIKCSPIEWEFDIWNSNV
jgi:hypothetical protein